MRLDNNRHHSLDAGIGFRRPSDTRHDAMAIFPSLAISGQSRNILERAIKFSGGPPTSSDTIFRHGRPSRPEEACRLKWADAI